MMALMSDSKSTNSSTWGSSESQKKKRFVDFSSEDSLAVSFEDQSNDSVRSKKVVYYSTSDSEGKAQKQNRTEELRLQNYRKLVQKEQELYRKKQLNTFRMFRARSAKLFGVTEDSWSEKMEGKRKIRPKTCPEYSKSIGSTKSKTTNPCENSKTVNCEKCSDIQDIITNYERESEKCHEKPEDHPGGMAPSENSTNSKTTCVFSDRQLKTFIRLLETEYFKEYPTLSNELNNKMFRENTDYRSGSFVSNADSLQKKVKDFCKRQQEFNKIHSVPKSIIIGLEEIRIQEAATGTKFG